MTKPNYYINFSDEKNKAVAEEIVALIAKHNKHPEERKAINKLEGAIHREYVVLNHSDVYELNHMLESIDLSLIDKNGLQYEIGDYLLNTINRIDIARENDTFRRSGQYHFLPELNHELDDAEKIGIRAYLSHFTGFNENNNPYGERELAFFNFVGKKCFFRIFYYNQDLTGYADPRGHKCRRVLVVGLASEY